MKTATQTTNPSGDTVQAAITALEELHGKMTYLAPLSPEQRRELRGNRMGPQSWRLLQGRVEAARKHRDLLPPAFDLQKFERDAALAAGLQSFLARLDQVRDDVSDTLRALGTRVLQDGALVYGHIKVAASARDSLHHAVGTLASRRGRTRRPNPGAVPAPSDVPAPVTAPASEPEPGSPTSPETPKQDAA